MTDDLDRFAQEIIAAALRDDQEALRENTHSLIVTCRQLRSELERERANGAMLDAARMVIESLRSRDWETVDRAMSYYKRVLGKE